jgi:hypothetical protein
MDSVEISANELKTRHRAIRDQQPEALRLRLYRATSWLARSEHEVDDFDARLIFQWVALHAAYAREFGFEQNECDLVKQFVEKLLGINREEHSQEVLFRQFTGPIRTLIDKRFVFGPFWKALREHDSSGKGEEQLSPAAASPSGLLWRGRRTCCCP